MTKLLLRVDVETNANPMATVIWLHSLSADGYDFEPIVKQLDLPKDATVRFISPHARSLSVTVNSSFVMPAWYDILEMNIEREIAKFLLQRSANTITAFINHEISRGISSDRIVLAGFSQDGAVAFEAAHSFPKKLAGLLALSTYLTLKSTMVIMILLFPYP